MDSARDSDERQVRLTERAALANVRTVLELCAAGALRCSEKTSRPTAATLRTVDAHLVHGDFYADEPIAAIAWPLLVQAGGLVKRDGTRLQLASKGRVALGEPPAEVVRNLWQRWPPPPSSLPTARSSAKAACGYAGCRPGFRSPSEKESGAPIPTDTSNALKSNAFAPNGRSVSEVSNRSRPRTKAQDDYVNRSNNPGSVDPSQVTFVFVTMRHFKHKVEWRDQRRADGIWNDVRVPLWKTRCPCSY